MTLLNLSATHPAVLATSIDPRVVAVLLKHLGTAAVEISEAEMKAAGLVCVSRDTHNRLCVSVYGGS